MCDACSRRLLGSINSLNVWVAMVLLSWHGLEFMLKVGALRVGYLTIVFVSKLAINQCERV